jgi:hypothetical protein
MRQHYDPDDFHDEDLDRYDEAEQDPEELAHRSTKAPACRSAP